MKRRRFTTAGDAAGVEPGGARVWVTRGEKVSLGNYESADVSIGAADDVQEGESIPEAIERLRSMVNEAVMRERRRIS